MRSSAETLFVLNSGGALSCCESEGKEDMMV
jgi:hypothetical protein